MPKGFPREVWISIGLIGVSLIAYSALLFWFNGDIEAKAKEIALSRALINQRAKSIEVLAGLKKNSREVDRKQELMAQLIPSKDELVNFPRWLEGIARLHEVSLVFSFDPATGAPQGSQPGFIAFRIEVAGSYEQLESFFQDIEQTSTRFLLSLNSMDFMRTDNGYKAVSGGVVFYK